MVLLYPELDDEHSALLALSNKIEDSTGIFRYLEEGFLEVLVFADDTFAWVDIEEVYQRGKVPKSEPAKLSVLRGDRSE